MLSAVTRECTHDKYAMVVSLECSSSKRDLELRHLVRMFCLLSKVLTSKEQETVEPIPYQYQSRLPARPQEAHDWRWSSQAGRQTHTLVLLAGIVSLPSLTPKVARTVLLDLGLREPQQRMGTHTRRAYKGRARYARLALLQVIQVQFSPNAARNGLHPRHHT